MVFSTKLYTTKLLKKLADLRLAIWLLASIGILIALGTFIEQDQPLAFYQENYPTTAPILGFVDWKFITSLNLNTLYSNIWFFGIVGFFASSLLACTYTTQIPALKKFRLWEFITNFKSLRKFQLKRQLPRNLASTSVYQLYGKNYHVFRQGKKNYAYSGLLGRVGPILVHFSILFVLFGSACGALGGYTVQEIVPRGEIFHLQNLVKSGNLSKIPQYLSWRVNDFWITYTEEAKVNQFYSDLSILDVKGQEVKRKIIFVNEPLVYNGVSVYQTDWDILGLKLKLNNQQTIQVPLNKISKSGRNFWLGSVFLDRNSKQKITILLNDLTGNIYVYDNAGLLVATTKLGQLVVFPEDQSLRFQEFLTTTGLQLKEDPGLRLIYLSFFLVMVSIYISFLSYSQIWGFEKTDEFILAGKSNRAVLAFQEDFKKDVKEILNTLKFN